MPIIPIRAYKFRRLVSNKLQPSLLPKCLQPSSESSWEVDDLEVATGEDDSLRRPPRDVPKGFLAVYVGQERRRFVIETHYLNHSLFKLLLDRSAREYGFDQKGGLRIPCEVLLFEHLMWMLDYDDPCARWLENLDELLNFYSSS
ncbi:hypothetical protein O6H91_06G079400 [Diphasiastrum complanatum]|uniref:Uncharacterized protein n=1 Tax=Diphasiastrum complanatum TaxID=34168 RepID=A0ACC2DFF9_DIPCM|nr:hypothetical protein O6H91_Y341800 [Diphasiastrum complanatum]KAJ7552978.1 hypothetical protein O6H91_06G079400 [Diphasiastrum complanatum]